MDFSITFLDRIHQLPATIDIDATLLGDGSSLTLQGANGGTTLAFPSVTVSSSALTTDDTLLPQGDQGVKLYDFGGLYGYVNGRPFANPLTGNSTCPTGQTAHTFFGQYNVDYPATFCYATSTANMPPLYDFGGMHGYTGGKPAVNVLTGATTCPVGYISATFYGTTNVDWPATFCYRPHVSDRPAEYGFGGMYGYVNGVPVPNPITGTSSCPSGYTASRIMGAMNVDYPAWYCYRKYTPPLAGHVYTIPVDTEPAGMIVDNAIAQRATYDSPFNIQNSDQTFTLRMPAPDAVSLDQLVAIGTNQWREFRCPFASLISAPDGGTSAYRATLDPTCLNDTKTLDGYSFSNITSVEGSPSFFSRHGQWAYLASPTPRVAVYLTQPASVTIIPRKQPHLLSIRGTMAQPVQNIHVRNIQFSYGGFQDIRHYITLQNGVHIRARANAIQDAAVEVERARNVSIEQSSFSHLLGAAVRIGDNAQSVRILGNQFSDIAGNGVEAGSWRVPDSETHAISALKIGGNTFTNMGRIFLDSGAIFATYIRDSEIADNIIDHAPYSGISLGWGWTYSPQTGLGNNIVRGNRISNVMEVLNDGAGIYLNSRMNGTNVYGNTIGPIGQTDSPWKNYPLYTDDGNGGVTIHDNVIKGVDFSKLQFVTTQQPVFGPMFPVTNPASPCKFKACDVQQYGNVVQ